MKELFKSILYFLFSFALLFPAAYCLGMTYKSFNPLMQVYLIVSVFIIALIVCVTIRAWVGRNLDDE